MTIKVYISQKAIDGIRRVIEAQYKHLPNFGIEPVLDPKEAHIICTHGADRGEYAPLGVPIVNVNHGLMWSRQPWGNDFMEVNRQVVEAMRCAVAHTAPSEWVNRAIRRGGYWYPETVYHGVDAWEFQPSTEHDGYVLWNKARVDLVSDPGDMIRVAEISPQVRFVSTFGSQNRAYTHPKNITITGMQPFQQMKKTLSRAGVYLATARETFGIGTLEAMAYGVPVAGWDWGGQSEIVKQGITGYLAPPGDYNALQECILRCFYERDRLSANCVEDVRLNWRWEPRIEQYANIFKRVYDRFYGSKKPSVSVVVTTYRLDKYLPACLDSVKTQTFQDFECLVVDDGQSADTKKIVSEYAKRDKRFRYIAPEVNLGLPGARNFGMQASRGEYIRHVDADDLLAENALELEVTALDTNRSVDIAYGHLEVIREDGSRVLENGEPVRGAWPPDRFNWYQQMAHLNQLPSCVMARRDVYERSGGYRERMKRNEDAEFWCRVTSLGFRAEKFTQAVTYLHRERHDSKGATEWNEHGSEPDWTAWFPWRMGATNFEQARDILRQRGETPRNSHLVPFGVQGKPPRDLGFWYVHDYAHPVVSIVVTCGPGHKKYLIDALDSIQAQTYPDWECVVVNDTGESWQNDIMGAPWAKVVNMNGNRGVSAARNEGLRHTRGKYIVWMDADDYWTPWFLEKMIGYAEANNGVIYSDLIAQEKDTNRVNRYKDFDSTLVIKTMQYPGSSVLVPRPIADAMVAFQGGFDEQIPGMEDWDYQVGVHHLGYCAYRIPEPLFVYRLETSTKRNKDYAKIDDIVAYMNRKWSVYRTGEKQIMCGCSTPRAPKTPIPESLLASSGSFTFESIMEAVDNKDPNMMVMIEYIGPQVDTFSIKSRVNRDILYRFGNNDHHRRRSVFVADAVFLMGQLDKDGASLYRVVSNVVGVQEGQDVSAFLGATIVA